MTIITPLLVRKGLGDGRWCVDMTDPTLQKHPPATKLSTSAKPDIALFALPFSRSQGMSNFPLPR